MFSKVQIEAAAQEKGLPFSWVEGKTHMEISLGDLHWSLYQDAGVDDAALALLADELGLKAPAHPLMAVWGTQEKVMGATFKPYTHTPPLDAGIGMVTSLFPQHMGIKMAFLAILPKWTEKGAPKKAEVAVFVTDGKGSKATWKWSKALLGEINL